MNQQPKSVLKSALQTAFDMLKVIELGGQFAPQVWEERMGVIETALKKPEKEHDGEPS